MFYVYTAVFEPSPEGYLVSVPDVPGCITEGADLPTATRSVKDALAGCLCSMEDHKVEIAPARRPDEIQAENPNAFLALVDVDTMRYRAETDNRAVRKIVSVPAWLNFQAEQAGINFSQVLQDGLKQQLHIG